MPVAGGGFEQCYNAQAAVAAGSLLVVATDVVQAPNDKRQVEPTLEKIAALPEELGEVENLLADTGYFSADNVEACDKAGVTPVIAMGRQPHHPPLGERFAPAPEPPKEPTPVEAIPPAEDPRWQRALRFPQADPEPVFGIIKSVLGFGPIFAPRPRKSPQQIELVTMAWIQEFRGNGVLDRRRAGRARRSLGCPDPARSVARAVLPRPLAEL